ncbi:MAG: metal ABC transporter substrate-binding protein [Actinomycetaceae bacterium]|nr:metal ABC transporter substrate-binding protein [Actinomycetaceae bacterium]
MTLKILTASLGVLALAAGCSSQGSAGASSSSASTESSQEAARTVSVSASFYPVAWLTEQIGGSHVQVTSVTPGNVEPHDFELAPKDVSALSSANLLVYVKGFQPSMDDAAATVSGPDILDLSSAVDLKPADPATVEEGEKMGSDPHFWLDPVRMQAAAQAITTQLAKQDSAHQADYDANMKALNEKLTDLDSQFKNGTQKCALTTVVTSHAAFGYLTNRYGLTQTPISGIDPESEPSPAELAAVKKVVESTKTTTIFTEELVSPKTAEAVASETGAHTAVLSPIESQPEKGDYISAMENNLKEIRSALSCK